VKPVHNAVLKKGRKNYALLHALAGIAFSYIKVIYTTKNDYRQKATGNKCKPVFSEAGVLEL
jgi:hypothetical protein